MKMLEVRVMLEDLRVARDRWTQARAEFQSGYEWTLTRLLHQAMINYMSVTDIATALRVSPRVVRTKMREAGLDPKSGKRVLSKTANAALIENAAIMGIEPGEMDLTSPLAYLPMGKQLRRAYEDKALAGVTDVDDDGEPEVSGNRPMFISEEALARLKDLREKGRAFTQINGACYDIRVEEFGEGYDEERPYISLDNVALLLGDDSHWQTKP